MKWHTLRDSEKVWRTTYVTLVPGAALVMVNDSDSSCVVAVPFALGSQEHDWNKWIKDNANESP